MSAPTNPPLQSVSRMAPGSSSPASRAKRIDFAMLLAQTKQETGFRVDAKSSDSGATGLSQFIDSTWLSLVQRFGEKYGSGNLAREIATDASGQATVGDPAVRERILGLRKDASLSAALAAEYARANRSEIERALGCPADNAALYMAHFLGATAAIALLKAVRQNGDTLGATLLPGAAVANHSVFYDAAGRARSLAEIYRSFAQRIDREAQRFAAAAGTASAVAAADVPCFIPRLGFYGQRLTSPMIAMLNAFALSALQMLAKPKPPVPLNQSRRAV